MLETLFKEMIDEIIRGVLPGSISLYFCYADAIQEHGGPSRVVEHLINWITSDLRKLEGQEATKSMLDSIKVKQRNNDEPWNIPLGYTGIVGDDRDLLWVG